jgi:PRTRC genetic system protein B
LNRALLVYGTSNYDGFPPRHPFVVLHEVVHEGPDAWLGAGQLLTPDGLGDIARQLSGTLPVEILPERVLVRSTDLIVWWMPASNRVMFFSDRGGDATMAGLNGAKYPHPPLVFKARGSSLWVRALIESKRPVSDTILQAAPYWNCDAAGQVCTGSMQIPTHTSVKVIDEWESAFFTSEFTHGRAGKLTTHPGGIVGLWKCLREKKRFPAKYLAATTETLSQFVNPSGRQTDGD